MMRMISKGYGVLAAVALLSSTGCLRKDVTHTLYLSPSGVTWSAMEKDVRSDETDAARQMAEEQDYILGVRAGVHGVARGLRALGATRVETTILRNDRPYTVLTEARFRDLASLTLAGIARLRIRGDASIDHAGCERTFRAWFAEGERDGDEPDGLADLLADGGGYRLVLTEGRFIRADGFLIEQDGTAATPAPGD